MTLSDRLMGIAGELGAAQVHLGKARSMLRTHRPDAAPIVELLQRQIYELAFDVALKAREVDPWGRVKKCRNCGKQIVKGRGAGRPRQSCSSRCTQDWHLAQRRLARARR